MPDEFRAAFGDLLEKVATQQRDSILDFEKLVFYLFPEEIWFPGFSDLLSFGGILFRPLKTIRSFEAVHNEREIKPVILSCMLLHN